MVKCCICFTTNKQKKDRKFYPFPRIHQRHSYQDKLVVEKRIIAWLKVTETNAKNKNRMLYVCSYHFVSGKPSYFMLTSDVDWVPSLNLGSMRQPQDPLSISTVNSLKKETDPSSKQSDAAPTNSNHEKDTPSTPIIVEPVKRKMIYSRLVPRLTATIITPESINISCNNSLLLNNLEVSNKCWEIVKSVSKDVTQNIDKNDKDTSTEAEALDDFLADDCELKAAYCFTSKLKEEKATQVTADEIRREFQLTASTQTLWK